MAGTAFVALASAWVGYWFGFMRGASVTEDTHIDRLRQQETSHDL